MRRGKTQDQLMSPMQLIDKCASVTTYQENTLMKHWLVTWSQIAIFCAAQVFQFVHIFESRGIATGLSLVSGSCHLHRLLHAGRIGRLLVDLTA